MKPRTDVARCMDRRANNFGEPGVCVYNTVDPRTNPDYIVRDDSITRYPTRALDYDASGNGFGSLNITNTLTPLQEEVPRFTLDHDALDAYYTRTNTTTDTSTSTRTSTTTTRSTTSRDEDYVPISRIIKDYL